WLWDGETSSERSNRASRLISSSTMCPIIATCSTTLEFPMSAASSSEAGWSSRLEPRLQVETFARADDPRLGDSIQIWDRSLESLRPGRGVLIGFPHDEGVQRNRGRHGSAKAPAEIRRWLCRLSAWDA